MSFAQAAFLAARRLPYAFAGLLVGNCVVNVVNLAVVIEEAESATGHLPLLKAGPFVLFPAFFLVSFVGWLLLGLPFTLFVPSSVVRRIHPLLGFLLGSIMGPLSLALVFLQGSLRFHRAPELLDVPSGLYLYAASVGGPAIAVYTVLVRRLECASPGSKSDRSKE